MYLSSTVDENVVQTDEKRKLLQGQGKLGYVRVVHQENSSLLKPTENLLKLLISVDFSRIFSVAVYLFK